MIQPHKGQRSVLESDARFLVVAAGRRWGKSELAYMLARKHIQQGHHVVWALARNMKKLLSARLVRWRLTEDFGGEGWRWFPALDRYYVKEHNALIRLVNAEKFPPDIDSSNTLFIVEEPAVISRDTWENRIQPTIAYSKGHVLLIGTPISHTPGRTPWFLEEGLNAISREDGKFFYSLGTGQNPAISQVEYNRLHEAMSELTWMTEILALFVEKGDPPKVVWPPSSDALGGDLR